MKKIKNVVLVSSMLILSTSVFAARAPIDGDYHEYQDSRTIKTAVVDSKAVAYSLGVEQLKLLQSESGRALSEDLSTSALSFKEINSIELNDGGYVTVQESMNAQGDIAYTGLVNVTYNYYRKD